MSVGFHTNAPTSTFMWVLGIQAHVLMLAQYFTLYIISPALQSYFRYTNHFTNLIVITLNNLTKNVWIMEPSSKSLPMNLRPFIIQSIDAAEREIDIGLITEDK